MSMPTRITSYLAALALLFGGALLIGGAVDPTVEESESEQTAAPAHEEEDETNGDSAAAIGGTRLPGLATVQDGYRIEAERMTTDRASRTPYSFQILGPDGEPVIEYDAEHDRKMHLIVVRRDFADFQHVHPELGADGTWTAAIDTSSAGVHRVFADFTTEGRSLTLATDLFVPGRFDPLPMPPPREADAVGDGYEVTIDTPELRPGSASSMQFTVSKDGRPIDTVQPYLGANGHLVALRAGDLAFLHTHPEGEPGDTGPITFDVEYPSAGSYRLFLQFRHGDAIRTAAFTQVVSDDGGEDAAVAPESDEHAAGGDHDAH